MLRFGDLMVAMALFASAGTLHIAAQNSVHPERKILDKVVPAYPQLAKRTNLTGVVKLEVVIRPNGTVKSARPLGGNPVLIDSAIEAVQKWRFEPAQQQTLEIVQVRFEPQ
jgi:TonB family protein